jgi:hypothetical protein
VCFATFLSGFAGSALGQPFLSPPSPGMIRPSPEPTGRQTTSRREETTMSPPKRQMHLGVFVLVPRVVDSEDSL